MRSVAETTSFNLSGTALKLPQAFDSISAEKLEAIALGHTPFTSSLNTQVQSKDLGVYHNLRRPIFSLRVGLTSSPGQPFIYEIPICSVPPEAFSSERHVNVITEPRLLLSMLSFGRSKPVITTISISEFAKKAEENGYKPKLTEGSIPPAYSDIIPEFLSSQKDLLLRYESYCEGSEPFTVKFGLKESVQRTIPKFFVYANFSPYFSGSEELARSEILKTLQKSDGYYSMEAVDKFLDSAPAEILTGKTTIRKVLDQIAIAQASNYILSVKCGAPCFPYRRDFYAFHEVAPHSVGNACQQRYIMDARKFPCPAIRAAGHILAEDLNPTSVKSSLIGGVTSCG